MTWHPFRSTSTAALVAAFFVSSVQAAPLPTKPPGGLDPSTVVGDYTLAQIAAAAFAGGTGTDANAASLITAEATTARANEAVDLATAKNALTTASAAQSAVTSAASNASAAQASAAAAINAASSALSVATGAQATASLAAPVSSPSFTGTPTTTTPASATDNSTRIPTTAWVTAFVAANASSTGTGTGTGLSTAQISELNGALQAAGGDASNVLITATGTSNNRTAAALSADEIAAKALASTALQPSAAGVSVAPLTSGKVPVAYLPVGTTTGTLADGGTLAAVQSTANTTQTSLTAAIASVSNLISLSAPASSSTACTAPAIKTPTINGVTYLVACTAAGTWGGFTALSSVAWSADPAAGATTTGSTTSSASLTTTAPASSDTACVRGSITNTTINGVTYLVACTSAGTWGAFTALSSIAWTSDPAAGATATATSTTPSITTSAPTSSATTCVPGSIANAIIGSTRYLFSCGSTGKLDAFTALSSAAWTTDPMTIANGSSSGTGTGTGTGTTTTATATAFSEVSPTGNLVLAYPTAGNIEYVVHPPTTAITISLNTATIHAGVPQSIFLKILPTAAAGAVTLSTTGVRWALDINGNPTPPSVSTTANAITIAQYDSWGDSASTVMGH